MDMSDDTADREEFGEESLKAAVLAENRERIYTWQWKEWKIACPVELRAGKDSRIIGGYALKFDRLSENLGGYVERIAPSFTNDSRSKGWPNVVCRWNHNDEMLLGTTHSGTLRLSTDELGLFYEVDCPECRGDVYEMVARRDVAHSSFAFEVTEQEWGVSEQNFPQRTLISGRIIDVAPVSSPAYRDTTVALRSLAKHLDVPIEDILQAHHERELRRFFIRTDNNGEVAKPLPSTSGMKAKMDLLAKRGEDPIGGQ
jgi:HK97 family phage prohead protease